MAQKIHILSSIFLAILAIIPSIMRHPNNIGGFMMFGVLLAIFMYVILGIYTIKNETIRFGYFVGLAWVFAYQLYHNIAIGTPIDKNIVVSLASTGVVAIILRVLYYFLGGPSSKSVKIYTVTDEVIANYLISVLQENKIDAFIDTVHTNVDPVISVAAGGEVNIMLKDNKEYSRALKIITEYFQNQENAAPWKCPKCQETIEGSFLVCWNCGYEK